MKHLSILLFLVLCAAVTFADPTAQILSSARISMSDYVLSLAPVGSMYVEKGLTPEKVAGRQ